MVSSTFSIKALATILSVLSATNAHMIMKTPIPYGRGVINNSPLDNSGSDYPCKNIFDMTDPVNDVNHLVPGVPATLSFTGSAVHGGGSCQVSLTKDLKPTKGSTWMVIKSIEGGCPANVDGNLPADPNGDGASTFQYTVPEGFPEGVYTIAWTWFNKIGNREMYMNCGRANIASSKKRYAPASKPKVVHRAADFPNLFTAQLSIFTCKIPEGNNVAFPQPGSDVQTVVPSLYTPTGCGVAAAAAPTGDSGSGSGSAASSAVASVATMSATGMETSAAATATGGFASGGGSGGGQATSAPVASGTGSGTQATGGPGVFASGAASSAESTAAASATASVVPIPAPSSPSSGSSSGNGSTSTGSNVAGTACSEEGAWSCSSDGTSFQRCASGVWSVPMQVAAGTTCTPGQSMSLDMKVGGSAHKRGTHQHARRVVGLSA